MDRSTVNEREALAAFGIPLAMMRRRQFLVGAGAVLGGIALPTVLSGCTPGGATSPGAAGSKSAGAGPRTLTIAYPDVPEVLDNRQADNYLAEEIARNLGCGDILRYKNVPVEGEDGLWMHDLKSPGFDGLDNAMAESWEYSEDLKTYTFKLRTDVVSAYGNPLTADDVIFSWKGRYWDKGFDGGKSTGRAGGIVSPDQFIKVDDRTIRVELQDSNNLFPKIDAIAGTGGLWDSKELLKHATEDDPYAFKWTKETGGGGYGAYTVESMTKGVEIVFKANPNYFRGEPYFQRVIWRGVAKSSERLAMLTRGDVDVALNLTGRELEQVRKTNGLDVAHFQGNKVVHLRVNHAKKPFDDVRVRQALAYAMPVDEVIASIYNGQARPLKSHLAEIIYGYTDKYWVYQQNIEKAKSLLAEAGVPDLSFEVVYDTQYPEHESIGVIMKTAFAQAGININLTGLAPSQYADKRNKREEEGAIGDNLSYVQDPAYVMQLFFWSEFAGNWANYKNEEYDQICLKLPTLQAGAEKDQLIDRGQEIWQHDQPWILICNPGSNYAHRAGLTGFAWAGDNTFGYELLADA